MEIYQLNKEWNIKLIFFTDQHRNYFSEITFDIKFERYRISFFNVNFIFNFFYEIKLKNIKKNLKN